MANYLNLLCKDVQKHLFNFLEPKEIVRMKEVEKGFRPLSTETIQKIFDRYSIEPALKKYSFIPHKEANNHIEKVVVGTFESIRHFRGDEVHLSLKDLVELEDRLNLVRFYTSIRLQNATLGLPDFTHPRLEDKCTAIHDLLREFSAAFLSVTELDLSNLNLTSLPSEIGFFKGLESLILKNNRLVTLPDEIGLLRRLETLDLENNRITRLPPSIQNLEKIFTINLRTNKLCDLPIEIARLRCLKYLVISGNQFREFPLELFTVSQLKALDLSNNKIRALPENIDEFVDLEILYVGYNQLRSLPPKISRLFSLKTLHINDNRIDHLPEDFSIRTLKTLNADHNLLTTLPASLRETIRNLRFISCMGNPIADHPENLPMELREFRDLIRMRPLACKRILDFTEVDSSEPKAKSTKSQHDAEND